MFKKVEFVVAGVCLGLALAGCGGGNLQTHESAQLPKKPVFSPRQVRRAFLRSGIRLSEEPQPPVPAALVGGFNDWPLVTYKSAAAGHAFRVDVYKTVAAALRSESITVVLLPEGEHVEGTVVKVTRRNVSATYDDGRILVRRKIEAALAALSRTQK